MSYLAEGEARGLVSLNNNRIRYIHAGKTYNFNDPEEKVRVEIYLQLVLLYGYAPERIDFEVNVPRRTPNDWADIVVYSDDARVAPYIIVECKKADVTDAEFQQAILQGFANANSIRAAYLWVTSGTLSRYLGENNSVYAKRKICRRNQSFERLRFRLNRISRFSSAKRRFKPVLYSRLISPEIP